MPLVCWNEKGYIWKPHSIVFICNQSLIVISSKRADSLHMGGRRYLAMCLTICLSLSSHWCWQSIAAHKYLIIQAQVCRAKQLSHCFLWINESLGSESSVFYCEVLLHSYETFFFYLKKKKVLLDFPSTYYFWNIYLPHTVLRAQEKKASNH